MLQKYLLVAAAGHGMARHGMARHGMAHHGMARHGMAWRGMAWRLSGHMAGASDKALKHISVITWLQC